MRRLGFETLEQRNLMATMPFLAGFFNQNQQYGFSVARPALIASPPTPTVQPQVGLGNPNQINIDELMRCVDHGFWRIGPSCVPGYLRPVATATLNTPTLVASASTVSQYIASANGAVNATKATYNVSATNGPITITELKFVIAGDDSSAVTKVSIGGVSATPVNGVAHLKGLSLAVPNGGAGLNFDTLVSYASVGVGGIPSGTRVSVGLFEAKYLANGTTKNLALPSPVMAPTMTLVGSKPTVIVNSTSNPGLMIGTQNEIGSFTVSAGAEGPVKVNDFQFAVASANFDVLPTFTSPRIADSRGVTFVGSSCGVGSAGMALQTIFCESATPGNVMASRINVANTESNFDFDGLVIPAGTSKTFYVYAMVTGTPIPGAVASVSTSLVAPGFNWDDTSWATSVADGAPASPTYGTNLTGSLINNFPTGSYVVHT